MPSSTRASGCRDSFPLPLREGAGGGEVQMSSTSTSSERRDPLPLPLPQGEGDFRPRRMRSIWSAIAGDRAALVSLVFLLVVIVIALAAPYVSPHDPNDAINKLRNAPPGS